MSCLLLHTDQSVHLRYKQETLSFETDKQFLQNYRIIEQIVVGLLPCDWLNNSLAAVGPTSVFLPKASYHVRSSTYHHKSREHF